MVKHLLSIIRLCYVEYLAQPEFKITKEAAAPTSRPYGYQYPLAMLAEMGASPKFIRACEAWDAKQSQRRIK